MKAAFDTKKFAGMLEKSGLKPSDISYQLALNGIQATSQAAVFWFKGDRRPSVDSFLGIVMEMGSKDEKKAAKLLFRSYFKEEK